MDRNYNLFVSSFSQAARWRFRVGSTFNQWFECYNYNHYNNDNNNDNNDNNNNNHNNNNHNNDHHHHHNNNNNNNPEALLSQEASVASRLNSKESSNFWGQP